MKNGDRYVLREDPLDVVHLSGDPSSLVRFAADGGGMVQRLERAEFDRKFRPQTPEDEARFNAVEKSFVTGDWFDDDRAIPAWLSHRNWNGSAMPAFELTDALAAADAGKLLGTYYYEKGDVFISLDRDGTAPAAFDPDVAGAVILERLAADPAFHEFDMGGELFTVDVWRPRDMVVGDGSTVRVYDIGAGYWTWDRADAPETSFSPSP